MKKFFQVLLFIPKLFIRLIWSLFLGLLQLALFLGLIFLIFYSFNPSQTSTVSEGLDQLLDNARSYLPGLEGKPSTGMPDKPEDLQTDDSTHFEGARWEKKSASIYIESSNPTFESAYRQAISNWNETGVFNFVLVEDASEANIIATDYSDGTAKSAGIAEMQIEEGSNRIRQAKVALNAHYLLNSDFGYDFDRILHTAEHELGHAIGLVHDDSHDSVMQSAGSFFGIQERDIEAVRKLYPE